MRLWNCVPTLLVIATLSSPLPAADLAVRTLGRFTVNVRGKLITLAVEKAPLVRLLKEIGQQAEIEVDYPSSIQSELVSDSFTDLPLEQALSRLLVGRSFVLFYRASDPRTTMRAFGGRLVLLAKDGGHSTPIAPPPAATRLAALERLSQRRDAAAVDEMARAMVDPDDEVRTRAQAMFDHALGEGAKPAAQRINLR